MTYDTVDRWRCFHCGQNFTEAEAETHFGSEKHPTAPLCQESVAVARESIRLAKSDIVSDRHILAIERLDMALEFLKIYK